MLAAASRRLARRAGAVPSRMLSSGTGPKEPLSGPGSAVQARSWMLRKKTKKQEKDGLIRVAMISGTVLGLAWIAKSLVWRQGTAELEELETKRQQQLDQYFAHEEQKKSPEVDWKTVEERAAEEEAVLAKAVAERAS